MPGKTSQGRRLTARRKFQIFLETRGKEAPVAEILRRWGLSPEQLREIEQVVETGALRALKVRSGRRALRRDVTPEAFEELRRELLEKEKALVELSVELALTKKGHRWGCEIEPAAAPSPSRHAR